MSGQHSPLLQMGGCRLAVFWWETRKPCTQGRAMLDQARCCTAGLCITACRAGPGNSCQEGSRQSSPITRIQVGTWELVLPLVNLTPVLFQML